jgi:hypothetical protein
VQVSGGGCQGGIDVCVGVDLLFRESNQRVIRWGNGLKRGNEEGDGGRREERLGENAEMDGQNTYPEDTRV